MLRGRGELDINAGTEALSAPPKSDLRGPFETDQRKAGHLRFSIRETAGAYLKAAGIAEAIV